MKKLVFVAASAAFALSATASAQSAQDRLDARYDRALAAGYKALFLCSAIANAEANGATRTPESVHEWELTGIYPALDPIIRDLPYEIVRRPSGQISHVQVSWADDMPDRIAGLSVAGRGCTVQRIGAPEDLAQPERSLPQSSASDFGLTPGDTAASAQLEQGLEATFSAAFDGTYGDGSRTTAVVVTTGDALAERYAEGFTARTPQRTWSVAKSIAATFVGAAIHSSDVEVSDPAITPYDEWGSARETRQLITVDHALRMASGRYSDTPGNRTDPLYWGGTTVDERALNWPIVHQPGTVYRYANNDTLLAVWAVYARTGGLDPAQELFSKLGMYHTVAERDVAGHYVLSSQVWSTARDLARLGQLYLNDGVWEGERILPEGWVEYVSDPSGPQPARGMGYGAGWWTFRRPEGNAFEGIPDDAFAARGNRGQYVVVVPSRDVVIVRRGEDMVGTRFDLAAFTRDVLAALEAQ